MKLNLKNWYKKRANRFKQFVHNLKIAWNNFLVWFYYRKKMLQLWWADAPKQQKWLEKGNHYLRKGAGVQVGQPINVPIPKKDYSKKAYKKMYIKNLFFNFDTNRIVANYSNKPIKGKSEPFIKAEKKSLKIEKIR